MSSIVLEAETRADVGKGASRRLRRLENKIPGILYGGDKKPETIHLLHNKVTKALENEAIYSAVFDLMVDGKKEQVILKAMQRHPYKPIIMHMDLQRVSAKDVLVRNIPVHFINEETCKGVKAGGIINHTMNQIEIRCEARNLPEFIEVDMLDVELNDVVHLSHIKLPKGVELTVDVSDHSHDLPVVSVHAPKAAPVDEEIEVAAEGEEAAAEEGEAASEESKGDEATE